MPDIALGAEGTEMKEGDTNPCLPATQSPGPEAGEVLNISLQDKFLALRTTAQLCIASPPESLVARL